jgi:hypothetical protein
MSKAVIGLVNTEGQAGYIIGELRAAGFNSNDISALLPDTRGTRDFAHEHNTKAPEGALAGVGAGGALGGTLGLLAGIGAIAIPGLGPLIAAGPLLAALSGAAVGATVGGITGALIGLGIPEIEAKRYEGKIKSGNILLAVHTEDGKQIDKAKEIFKRNGADDVSTVGEVTAKGGSASSWQETPRAPVFTAPPTQPTPRR